MQAASYRPRVSNNSWLLSSLCWLSSAVTIFIVCSCPLVSVVDWCHSNQVYCALCSPACCWLVLCVLPPAVGCVRSGLLCACNRPILVNWQFYDERWLMMIGAAHGLKARQCFHAFGRLLYQMCIWPLPTGASIASRVWELWMMLSCSVVFWHGPDFGSRSCSWRKV